MREMWTGKTPRGGVGSEHSLLSLPLPLLPLTFSRSLTSRHNPLSDHLEQALLVKLLKNRCETMSNPSFSRGCTLAYFACSTIPKENNTLRNQSTFLDAITSFITKWRLRNEHKNSILMTRYYPDLGSTFDWLYRKRNLLHAVIIATGVVFLDPYRDNSPITNWLKIFSLDVQNIHTLIFGQA